MKFLALESNNGQTGFVGKLALILGGLLGLLILWTGLLSLLLAIAAFHLKGSGIAAAAGAALLLLGSKLLLRTIRRLGLGSGS